MLKRLDCPWGGGSVQCLHALASRQPALGRPELRQGQGHGGIQRWPQDALAAPSDFRALGTLAADPAGATTLDLLLSGPLLPQCGVPGKPGPGQWLRGGGDPRDFGVVSTTLEAVCGITQCDFADFIYLFIFSFIFKLVGLVSLLLGPVLKSTIHLGRAQPCRHVWTASAAVFLSFHWLLQIPKSFFILVIFIN